LPILAFDVAHLSTCPQSTTTYCSPLLSPSSPRPIHPHPLSHFHSHLRLDHPDVSLPSPSLMGKEGCVGKRSVRGRLASDVQGGREVRLMRCTVLTPSFLQLRVAPRCLSSCAALLLVFLEGRRGSRSGALGARASSTASCLQLAPVRLVLTARPRLRPPDLIQPFAPRPRCALRAGRSPRAR
jgi:hypothetical protein